MPTYDGHVGSFDTNTHSMQTDPDRAARGNPWRPANTSTSGIDESFGPSVDGSIMLNKSDFIDKGQLDAGPFAAPGRKEDLDDDFEDDYDDEEEEIVDHEAKIEEVYHKYKGKDQIQDEESLENQESYDFEPKVEQTPGKPRFKALAIES